MRLPHYGKPQVFTNKTFFDQNWPGPFALKNENPLTEEELTNLHKHLKKLFN